MNKFFKGTFRFIGALFALIRGIVILCMVIMLGITGYFIYTAADVTINQYNESLVWEKTAYNTALSQIEPALVRNVIDTDIVDAAESWEELEQYVNDLDGEPVKDLAYAESILASASKWQEKYGLRSESIDRLSLYLELENEIPKAYETLDTSGLEQMASRLYAMEIEKKTISGQKYMERIKEVSKDFIKVKTLMTETIGSIGTMDEGIWTIPYTYTRTDLTGILEQMESMKKFPAVNSSSKILSDISGVLNYNKNTRDYFEYLEFKQKIESVARSQYTAVSSIYTYGQAVAFGCQVQVMEREGFTISMDSPVTGIYYNGGLLDGSQYVKNGTYLTADINPVYEPIPVQETNQNMGWSQYTQEPQYTQEHQYTQEPQYTQDQPYEQESEPLYTTEGWNG